MADRQLISEELLQERFGNDHIMEKIRMLREQRERVGGQRQSKAGPYHEPQYGISLKKLALQNGEVTPGEVGLTQKAKHEHLRMYEKQEGEIPNAERQEKIAQQKGGPVDTNKSRIPQQGRPKNSKDSKQRKKKEFKPKKKASLVIWAKDAQIHIANELNDLILKQYNKKNMRSLSSEEMLTSEDLRFSVLYALQPFFDLTTQTILAALKNNKQFNLIKPAYDEFVGEVRAEINRELTIDEIRALQVDFYVRRFIDG